jgi:hypothetical protein
MKKILILLLFLVLGWAASTWFIGNETETLLKTYLQNSKKAYAEMGMKTQYEVKEYKKSFFKSTAKTVFSLNTGDTEIDTIFKDLQFNNTITHGPILWVEGVPSFGTAHIHSTLDVDALEPEAKTLLKLIFADNNPLSVNITFGLNETANYELIIPAIDIKEEDSYFNLKEGIYISGVFDKSTLIGTAKGTLGSLTLKDDGLVINASSSSFKMDMQGLVAGQMIGRAHFSMPSIKIEAEAMSPISFGIDFTSDTRKVNGDALEGDIKLTASNIKTPLEMTDIKLNASFKGLQIKGLEQLVAIQTDLQQLRAGASNGKENPNEEEQAALMNKLQNLPNIMAAALQNTFKKDQTAISISANIVAKQDNSHLAIKSHYIGNGADINLEELATGGLIAILKIVNGSLDLKASKAMLTSTPAAIVLLPLIKQGIIVENEKSYTLNAIFKADTITLNDKVMTANEFANVLEVGGVTGSDNVLPAGIELPDEEKQVLMQNIPPQLLEELATQSIEALKEQGLPEEIIEQIKVIKQQKVE